MSDKNAKKKWGKDQVDEKSKRTKFFELKMESILKVRMNSDPKRHMYAIDVSHKDACRAKRMLGKCAFQSEIK